MSIIIQNTLIISGCLLYIILVGVCSYYCHSTNKCCYKDTYNDYKEI